MAAMTSGSRSSSIRTLEVVTRTLDGNNNNNNNYNYDNTYNNNGDNNNYNNNGKNNGQQANNNNNNNSNNYNNQLWVAEYQEGFDGYLFIGTIGVCGVIFLYILWRISSHRKRKVESCQEQQLSEDGSSEIKRVIWKSDDKNNSKSNNNTKTSSSFASSIYANQRYRLSPCDEEELPSSMAFTFTNHQNKVQNELVSEEEMYDYVLPYKREDTRYEAEKVMKFSDEETKRILELCKPFWFNAFVSGVCELCFAVLISKRLGVDAVTIYYIVNVPITFTTTMISSIIDAIAILCGQSIGVESYTLTGRYCLISIVLYTVLYTFHSLLWILYLKPVLQWFGPNLNEDIINEGYNYFLVGILGGYIEALATVLHNLFGVLDHVDYEMKSNVCNNILCLVSFYLYILFYEDGDGQDKNNNGLVVMEFIFTGIAFIFLMIDLSTTFKNEWLHDDVWKGMNPLLFSNVAAQSSSSSSTSKQNWEAAACVVKTAIPMSFGNILLTIEWEILTLLAATLGEKYIAAWGIIGSIWGMLEYTTICVASAAEIRVAKLLGEGNPRLAKLSSYKCLFIGNVCGAFMSTVFFIFIPWIPQLLTNDDELMASISVALPYCAIGNLTLTVGSLAWTLVGAQGRYTLATVHGSIGSLLVTIPFACVSILCLHWGLQSLAASIILGYMVSGALNLIALITSDWDYISYKVMVENGATGTSRLGWSGFAVLYTSKNNLPYVRTY